jgi:hypothetical protein
MARPEAGLELIDIGVEQICRAYTTRDSTGNVTKHTDHSGVYLSMLALFLPNTSPQAM